jgi:hypothetical protein
LYDVFAAMGRNTFTNFTEIVYFLNSKLFVGYDIMSRFDNSPPKEGEADGSTYNEGKLTPITHFDEKQERENLHIYERLRTHLTPQLERMLTNEILLPYTEIDINSAREEYIVKCITMVTRAIEITNVILAQMSGRMRFKIEPKTTHKKSGKSSKKRRK